MAAPSYTTNLAVIWDATNNTGWSELSGHTSGGADAYETDYYIQRSGCISQSTGVATGQNAGLEYDYGSNVTFSTGYCLFMWQIFLAPNAITSWATGGMRIVAGSSSGNVYHWNAVGNDFGKYPYGGWQNTAIDPTYSADGQDGTPTGNWRIFGSLPNIGSAVSKGNPHGVDVVRYGRGDIVVTGGDGTSGYAVFYTSTGPAGMSVTNDSQNNKWGLFQKEGTGYTWKGLMSLGTSGTAVDFRDSNKNITVDDTPRTYSSFNKIEISNASSRVDWTGISFQSVNESGLSRGDFEMVNNADVNFDGCTFTGMNTFIFQSNATVLDTTFRRCNLVTLGGGDFTGCNFLASTVAADASAARWNTNANVSTSLDGTTWSKGTNAHHALAFGTAAATTQNLTDWTVTGFNASDGQNDSVLYFEDRGSDTTWTINVSGNSGTISYKKARAGDTVNILTDQRTITINARDSAGALITDSTDFTLVRESDLTVLLFDEDQTDGSTSYTYSYSSDTACYINVVSSGAYIPVTQENVTLGNADQTVNVILPADRAYSNPT